MPFDGSEPRFSQLEKLDQVIDLIGTPDRWIKYTYRNPRGGYCLKEALNVAGAAGVFEPLILSIAEEVTELEFCCVESFNDHPATTHGNVMAVLTRVRDGVSRGRFSLPDLGTAQPVFAWKPSSKGALSGWISAAFRKVFC